MVLFILTGYILHSSLQKKDQDLLQNKFQEYSSLLKNDGVAGLQLRVSSQSIPDASRFLVRYESQSGKTLFLHVPESMEIVGWTITLEGLDDFLKSKAKNSEQWIEVPGPEYGDDVEIFSKTLDDGSILQIGKDTEDREEFLKEFVRSFAIGLFPVMSLAIMIGLFLSGRILSPIRWLTQTVQEIRFGRTGARVPVSGNQDELDELGKLFNQMQDQNEKLVIGMKQTLDHVAHDLRTPVMRIQNSAQKALEKSNNEVVIPPYIDTLVDCQENSETILKMLNAIMDISEVETGTMLLQKEKLQVSKLIESVLDIYEFIAEEKEVTVSRSIPEDLYINGDKGRLLQSLGNLIDNAIKYTTEKSSVEIKAYLQGDQIILDIIDQGAGIPENEMSRIWDRLYRGDQSRTSRGLGLGLSFVQAIAHAHQSTIEVFNNPSKGCTFRLTFRPA